MADPVLMEKLIYQVLGDNRSLRKTLEQSSGLASRTAAEMNKAFAGFGNATTRINLATGGINTYLRGALAGFAALAGVGKSLTLASTLEETTIAFDVMLGSQTKAVKLLKEIQDFADVTPLQATDLQAGAKTLIQYGVSADKVMKVMQQLGDVSGGNAEHFSRLALAYGQTTAAGRLMGNDILQMVNAGFNPLREIVRVTGISMEELRNKQERGAVSSEVMAKAFETATAKGGMFFGLLQRQGQTVKGLFSTLKDTGVGTLRELGIVLTEEIGLHNVIRGLNDLVKEMKGPMIKSAKALVDFFKDWRTHLVGITVILPVILGRIGSILASSKTLAMTWAVIKFLLSPIGASLAAVTAGLVLAIHNTGGWANAWKVVKAAAADFWNYISPVLSSLGSLASSVFGVVKDTAIVAFEGIKKAASSMGIDIKGDWTAIRNWVVNKIYEMEFAYLHFWDVAKGQGAAALHDLMELGRRLGSLLPDALDTIMGRKPKGPGPVGQAQKEWFDKATKLLKDNDEKFKEFMKMKEIFNQPRALMAEPGKMTLKDQLVQNEKDARNELDNFKKTIDKKGDEIHQAISKALKFDSAVKGSSEAFARIREMLDFGSVDYNPSHKTKKTNEGREEFSNRLKALQDKHLAAQQALDKVMGGPRNAGDQKAWIDNMVQRMQGMKGIKGGIFGGAVPDVPFGQAGGAPGRAGLIQDQLKNAEAAKKAEDEAAIARDKQNKLLQDKAAEARKRVRDEARQGLLPEKFREDVLREKFPKASDETIRKMLDRQNVRAKEAQDKLLEGDRKQKAGQIGAGDPLAADLIETIKEARLPADVKEERARAEKEAAGKAKLEADRREGARLDALREKEIRDKLDLEESQKAEQARKQKEFDESPAGIRLKGIRQGKIAPQTEEEQNQWGKDIPGNTSRQDGGVGSSGIGVLEQIAEAMLKLVALTEKQAGRPVFSLDTADLETA